MAKGTLEPERSDPFMAAKMETITAALTAPEALRAPWTPRIRRIISVATRSLPATSELLNTAK